MQAEKNCHRLRETKETLQPNTIHNTILYLLHWKEKKTKF